MPDTDTLALLLAAGRGRRFDPSGVQDKLMADVQGVPVAVRSARSLREAGLPVVAIVRPDAGPLENALHAAGCASVHVCTDADAGLGHSLSFGVRRAIADHHPRSILVALADMPFIAAGTHRAVAERVSPAASIVAAAFGGRRGHPVAFSQAWFDALSELSGDQGAGALLRRHPVILVDTEDDAVLRDIDRPDDLATT